MVRVIRFKRYFDFGEIGFAARIVSFEDLFHRIQANKKGKSKNNYDADNNKKFGKGVTISMVSH